MRRLCLCIYLLIIIPSTFLGQVTEEWVARYSGFGNYRDEAYAIAVDNSGNVYVTGRSYVVDTDEDYATIKYNSAGEVLWMAHYNEQTAGYDDLALSIALDKSGNVYVTGSSYGDGTTYDYATVKYNSSGEEQWAARYNAPGNNYDIAFALAVDNSGYVYVTGYGYDEVSQKDYVTIKYNSDGDEEWVARYKGPGNEFDEAYAIAVDNSGNVYVTGRSYGDGTSYDYATIKYNSDGDEEWVARYNGYLESPDEASAIAVDISGNVYVTGYSDIRDDYDFTTVKYNSVGEEEWVARYNGPLTYSDDLAWAMALDNSGNVYVTGWSQGEDYDFDYATVKYNSHGEEQWVARYDGPEGGPAGANDIALDDAGNVYLTGSSCGFGYDETALDYATVKYDSEGHEQWVARYNSPADDADEAKSIVVDNNGNVYVTGKSFDQYRHLDYITIKYSQGSGITEKPVSSLIKVTATLSHLFYNLSGQAQLNLYSADGRKVLAQTVEGQGTWEAPEMLSQGVYFARIDTGEYRQTLKLVKIN